MRANTSRKTLDPADYDGRPLCPCCFSGWPGCRQRKPDGELWSHAETCQRYRVGALCSSCAAAIGDWGNPS